MKKCIVLLLALFLLTGCTAQEKPAAPTASCQEIAEKVMAAAGFQELTAINEKYLEKHFLIQADALEDWALYRDATRATPEMVLIVRVKSDADQAAIQKALNAYNSEQLTLYRDYQPDQVVKLEQAKVLQNGSYLALIVSPDADKTTAALGQGWRE